MLCSRSIVPKCQFNWEVPNTFIIRVRVILFWKYFLILLYLVWKRDVFLSRVRLMWSTVVWTSFFHLSLSCANSVTRCSLIIVISSIAIVHVRRVLGFLLLSLKYCLCNTFVAHTKQLLISYESNIQNFESIFQIKLTIEFINFNFCKKCLKY